MAEETLERGTFVFRGRVQGVGFRATVDDIARSFQVVGQVRNLTNGDVEMIAEGNPAEIQAFCASIETEMKRNIVDIHQQWQTIRQKSFANFSIAATGSPRGNPLR